MSSWFRQSGVLSPRLVVEPVETHQWVPINANRSVVVPALRPGRIPIGARRLYILGHLDPGQALSHHISEANVNNQPIVPLILKGIALAMGVATVVLSILGTSSTNTLITLLGIGLFCLALWAFQKGQ